MNTTEFKKEALPAVPNSLLKENEKLSQQVSDLKKANETLQHNYDVLV